MHLGVAQDGGLRTRARSGSAIAFPGDTIAQLTVATFSNPEGLDREGNNDFSVSASSGKAQIGAGNTGGRGAVQQGSLESSNVDISLEFTRLIIAQRGFEVNARTISVSDQILQDLTQIIIR